MPAAWRGRSGEGEGRQAPSVCGSRWLPARSVNDRRRLELGASGKCCLLWSPAVCCARRSTLCAGSSANLRFAAAARTRAALGSKPTRSGAPSLASRSNFRVATRPGRPGAAMPVKLGFSVAGCSGEVRAGGALTSVAHCRRPPAAANSPRSEPHPRPMLPTLQDADFPASELLLHSPDSKGWCTPRCGGCRGGRWRASPPRVC